MINDVHWWMNGLNANGLVSVNRLRGDDWYFWNVFTRLIRMDPRWHAARVTRVAYLRGQLLKSDKSFRFYWQEEFVLLQYIFYFLFYRYGGMDRIWKICIINRQTPHIVLMLQLNESTWKVFKFAHWFHSKDKNIFGLAFSLVRRRSIQHIHLHTVIHS